MIKKLSQFVGPYKIYAILSPILIFGEVVCDVFIPRLMARIVDIGIPNQDYSYIVRTGALMILLALVALLLGAGCAYCAVKASNGINTL